MTIYDILLSEKVWYNDNNEMKGADRYGKH